ncbi:unnamed protein product [Sphagnum jensenii]|uniref:Beta-amylase n=1 Tax=Sphagnum jensenii TaxID=128206 RepID=A0ABP1A993_9BRYO
MSSQVTAESRTRAATSGSGDETGIPVFVMLPLDILNGQRNEINYKETDSKRKGKEYKVLSAAERPLRADLDYLKNAGVKGVMVDCWWGIVEAEGPGQYNWKGYDRLFSIICDAGLDLHVRLLPKAVRQAWAHMNCVIFRGFEVLHV